MSKFILGTAQFGLNYGINNVIGKTKENDVFSILDYASECGICQIDTASAYGDAEELIGKYLKNNNQKFEITTKFSLQTTERLSENIELSLSRLSLDRINTILFHSYHDYNIYKDQLNEFVSEFKHKYFSNIGVSIYTNDEINGLLEDDNVDVVQSPYNMLDNYNLRGDSFVKLKSNKKTINVRSVFLQGLFFMKKDQLKGQLLTFSKPIKDLNEYCLDSGISMHQMALSYVYNNPSIDGVIIGVDSLDQLKTNLEASLKKIPNDIIKKIESIRVVEQELLNPTKWKI